MRLSKIRGCLMACVLVAVALCLAACGGSNAAMQVASQGPDASGSPSGFVASSSADSGAGSAAAVKVLFRDTRASSVAVEGELPAHSVLLFDDNSTSKFLSAEMNAGNVPVRCTVRFEEEGGICAYDVFDSDQIVGLYNALAQVTVAGKSDMSVLDASCRLSFDMQNGRSVGFSFEGYSLLSWDDGNYETSGTDGLWALVNQIRADYDSRVAAQGVRSIAVIAGDDLLESCPEQAIPGDWVCVRTAEVHGEFVRVEVDGEEAESWGDAFYLFVMPDADVEVSAIAEKTPDGCPS